MGFTARVDCQKSDGFVCHYWAEAVLLARTFARKSSLMKFGPSLLYLFTVVVVASGGLLSAQDASSEASTEVAASPAIEDPSANVVADGSLAEEVGQSAPSLLEQFFGNPLNLLLISGILFVMLVLRPQQKQAKEMQAALAGLKKNDKVVTASGIHGTVVTAGSDEAVVTIRIDDNSGARMTVNRDAIAKIINSETKE